MRFPLVFRSKYEDVKEDLQRAREIIYDLEKKLDIADNNDKRGPDGRFIKDDTVVS